MWSLDFEIMFSQFAVLVEQRLVKSVEYRTLGYDGCGEMNRVRHCYTALSFREKAMEFSSKFGDSFVYGHRSENFVCESRFQHVEFRIFAFIQG